MIDLSPQHLITVKRILANHVPEREVRVFGSRISGTSSAHSDLDVVIIGKDKLPRITLVLLKEAFENSVLPFTVDLLDWCRISPEFQTNIEKQCEIIQMSTRSKLS